MTAKGIGISTILAIIVVIAVSIVSSCCLFYHLGDGEGGPVKKIPKGKIEIYFKDTAENEWIKGTPGLGWGWGEGYWPPYTYEPGRVDFPSAPGFRSYEYWQGLYGDATVLYVAVGLNYYGAESGNAFGVSLYVDDVTINGVTYDLEPGITHELEVIGDGIAEWTPEVAHSGDYSVKLTIPEGASSLSFAIFKIPYGKTLSTLAPPSCYLTISNYANFKLRATFLLYLDKTGDGEADSLIFADDVLVGGKEYPYGMGTCILGVVCPEPYGYVEPTIAKIQLLNENGAWITIWEGLESITLFPGEPGKFFAEVEVPTGVYIGTRMIWYRLAHQVKWTEKRVTIENGIVVREEVLDSWIENYFRDIEQYVVGDWPGTWVYEGGKVAIVYDISIVDLGEFEDPIAFMETLRNPSWGIVKHVWTVEIKTAIGE